MSVYNSIIELKKQERYSEAGYGCLFAYSSGKSFNAMIDARMKSKYLRQMNPEMYAETQDELVYSGPTVFFDQSKEIQFHKIDKIDIKSAYPAFLVNTNIQKVGMMRVRELQFHKHDDRLRLYVVRFICDIDNIFVKWFLNSSAIHKKKFKMNGNQVYGDVSIFSCTDMDNLKYIYRFLGDSAEIIKSYIFLGPEIAPVNKEQIYKLYKQKEYGNTSAKKMLVQATGWLSIIDKPTYYYMLQYIKHHLLETVYNYGLDLDVVGVQTDCIFFRVNTRTEGAAQKILDDRLSVSNKELSSIGIYTHQRVNYDEIITKTARVVLRDV